MSGVNEAIVREYFESLGFVVSQPCKYISSGRRKTAVEELDLIVFNPLNNRHRVADSLEWTADDIRNITRAVVAVRGRSNLPGGRSLTHDLPAGSLAPDAHGSQ